MPRRKCSPEEEVANLNRRATEVANKSMKRSVEIALKNKPSIVKPLYDKMVSLGVSESNLMVREDGPLSFAAMSAVQRQKNKQEFVPVPAKAEDGGVPEFVILDAVPERCWRLGVLFSSYLYEDRAAN